MEQIKPHERENLTGEGGINCEIKEGEGFIKIMAAFTKKIAKKIMTGQFNFGTMQRPTLLSNPVSHVQVMADELSVIIQKCKLMAVTPDPLDKLKHLVSGVIGNLSYSALKAGGRGPVNPTLGETLTVS